MSDVVITETKAHLNSRRCKQVKGKVVYVWNKNVGHRLVLEKNDLKTNCEGMMSH